MSTDPDTKAALADPALAAQATLKEADDKAAALREAASNNGSEDDKGNPGELPEAKEEPAKVEEPKQEDTKEAELDTEVWGSTGDETGDSVLFLLQQSGIEPDTAKALLFDAVRDGDPTKIDRDALIEKVGKATANLVMAGIENFVGKQAAKVAETTKIVFDAAGSPDAWKKVAEWSAKGLSDADREEFRSLIDKGGRSAQFAAAEMVKLYNADSSNTSLGKTVRLEGDGKAPDSGRAIGRREYADELMRAHARGASNAVIKEIQNARERGRKRGL